MDSAKMSQKGHSIGNLLAEIEAEIERLEGLIQEAEEGKSYDPDDRDAA